MRTLEPLLNRRICLDRVVADRQRIHLDLGPSRGLILKHVDFLFDSHVSTTGFLLAGLALDPNMTIPSTTTDWVSDERIPLQILQEFDVSAAGRFMTPNMQVPMKVPEEGLVLVHDYQLMMRVTAGAAVEVCFTLWYKRVEFDLDEWVYHMQKSFTGGI